MSENWFLGSSLPIVNVNNKNLSAFNSRGDVIQLKKDNNKVYGYAGTIDSYVKLFYVSCAKLWYLDIKEIN